MDDYFYDLNDVEMSFIYGEWERFWDDEDYFFLESLYQEQEGE